MESEDCERKSKKPKKQKKDEIFVCVRENVLWAYLPLLELGLFEPNLLTDSPKFHFPKQSLVFTVHISVAGCRHSPYSGELHNFSLICCFFFPWKMN